MQAESDVRLNQGSNYNRQQNRFSNFNPRERARFPEAATEQPNTYDRYKDKCPWWLHPGTPNLETNDGTTWF